MFFELKAKREKVQNTYSKNKQLIGETMKIDSLMVKIQNIRSINFCLNLLHAQKQLRLKLIR